VDPPFCRGATPPKGDPRGGGLRRVGVCRLAAAAEETPEKKPRFGSGRVFEGLVHAVLGDKGAAFSAWRQIDDWWINLHLLRYCFSDVLAPLRRDPRYEKLIHEINEYWGLNPDGSIPDSVGVSLPSNPEADA
jgi:hypothetical protein